MPESWAPMASLLPSETWNYFSRRRSAGLEYKFLTWGEGHTIELVFTVGVHGDNLPCGCAESEPPADIGAHHQNGVSRVEGRCHAGVVHFLIPLSLTLIPINKETIRSAREKSLVAVISTHAPQLFRMALKPLSILVKYSKAAANS